MSKAQKGLGSFLDAYKPQKSGSKCWLCSIPEREEIDAERRKRGSGCGVSAVVEYLRAIHGGIVTRARVNGHFGERHHER